MSGTNELKRIKRLYGEKFMHLCRELFPTLLEQEGLLTEILTSSFSTNSRTLAEDIQKEKLEEKFRAFVINKQKQERENEIIGDKTPFELLEEAGYDLYECTTEEDIQEFRKYYEKGEELCTFKGGRLKRCLVFFAVRKDVDKIKREDFEKPKREDKYGTSVMSIQFSKDGICNVSIKNRYNHTVNNPDATYGNDLDKITPGLRKSFSNLLKEKSLTLDSSNEEKMDFVSYTVANDGKYYKYNIELNGIYYCPGNIIIEYGNVKKLESEKQMLIGYFIVDKENKTLRIYDETLRDTFTDTITDIEEIDVRKLTPEEIGKNPEKQGNRKIIVKQKGRENPVVIEVDQDNNLVMYKNEYITEIEDNFLHYYNTTLQELELPEVVSVGDNFLRSVQGLKELNLPKAKKIGNNALLINYNIKHLNLPEIEYIGDNFLAFNETLTELRLPKLKQVGKSFMTRKNLEVIELPSLEKADRGFFGYTSTGNTDYKEIIEEYLKIKEYFRMESQKTRERIGIDEIALLDKRNNLLPSEINEARDSIQKENSIEKED